jgi:proteasome lid subunit RPN8/RPN11
MTGGFRYLIPEQTYDELLNIAKDAGDKIASGWVFADRKENFGIVTGYVTSTKDSDAHIRPKSWIRVKKKKIYDMRKLKVEKGVDIVWQFHTHPDNKEELNEVDKQILNYLSTGVMIIVTEKNLVGWFFDKRETKKPIIDKMIFEIISE